jgi:hypothetical protein
LSAIASKLTGVAPFFEPIAPFIGGRSGRRLWTSGRLTGS